MAQSRRSRKVPSTAACASLVPEILKVWKAGLAHENIAIQLETSKIVAPYAIQKMPAAVEVTGKEGGPVIHSVTVTIRHA